MGCLRKGCFILGCGAFRRLAVNMSLIVGAGTATVALEEKFHSTHYHRMGLESIFIAWQSTRLFWCIIGCTNTSFGHIVNRKVTFFVGVLCKM